MILKVFVLEMYSIFTNCVILLNYLQKLHLVGYFPQRFGCVERKTMSAQIKVTSEEILPSILQNLEKNNLFIFQLCPPLQQNYSKACE